MPTLILIPHPGRFSFLLALSCLLQVDPHLGGYDEFDLSSNELQEWALRTSMEGQIALDKQGGDDTTQRTSTVGSDAAQANASLAFSKAWATALASEQVARHGCRYHHLQMPSADAATLFQRESLDMVTYGNESLEQRDTISQNVVSSTNSFTTSTCS